MTEGTDNIKKIVLSKRKAVLFRKAEKDQKILEEKAAKMNYEMPVSKVIEEQIVMIRFLQAEAVRIKRLKKEKKFVLYDANGEPIKHT